MRLAQTKTNNEKRLQVKLKMHCAGPFGCKTRYSGHLLSRLTRILSPQHLKTPHSYIVREVTGTKWIKAKQLLAPKLWNLLHTIYCIYKYLIHCPPWQQKLWVSLDIKFLKLAKIAIWLLQHKIKKKGVGVGGIQIYIFASIKVGFGCFFLGFLADGWI